MKIPETSANVGAYYGNEENGQWQSSQYVLVAAPNGVHDTGVGGGVVGSGDAGARPMYPHIPRHMPGTDPMYPHIPRHMPGYMMGGGYYNGPYPPIQPNVDDFADYMWMENEEEFDKQVMQQLEEEALMEQCIEAMLEDEQREQRLHSHNGHPATSNGASSLSLEEAVSRSTLNPLAAEFVPTRVRPAEDKPESPPEPSPQIETKQTEESHTREERETTPQKESRTEEITATPPEVSAADLESDERKTNIKQAETKTPKVKPQPPAPVKEVQSDTKLVHKETRDTKATKSDTAVMDDAVIAVEAKPSPPPEEQTGPKPINYAAAAKANKKKASTPPACEKPTPQPTLRIEKKIKPATKTDKVARKNSAK